MDQARKTPNENPNNGPSSRWRRYAMHAVAAVVIAGSGWIGWADEGPTTGVETALKAAQVVEVMRRRREDD